MPEIEAVLLTGGASTRMGSDKASIIVDGEPLGVLIAARLALAGYPVTVCGAEPIQDCSFIPDATPHAGPLAALAGFTPTAPFVFVTACDLPRFDANVVAVLKERIGSSDAAVPLVDGRMQPLAALYTANAFSIARACCDEGRQSMMAWLDRLNVQPVDAADLELLGIEVEVLAGANTAEDLARLTKP